MKKVWKFSIPETKILVVLCYYGFFGVVTLSLLSVESIEQEVQSTAIQEYFICEAAGSSSECDRSSFATVGAQGLVLLNYLMLGLVPTVNLIFVVQWRALKKSCQQFWMLSLKDLIKSNILYCRAFAE